MTGTMPPVPGVHARTCPGCGAREVITSDTSRPVSRGDLVEVREHDCAGCGRTYRFRIPAWRDDATDQDVSAIGEWFSRRRRSAALAKREKEMAIEREGGTNG